MTDLKKSFQITYFESFRENSEIQNNSDQILLIARYNLYQKRPVKARIAISQIGR